MFDLMVVSPQRVLFDEAVERILIDGDDNEYELSSFHAHLIGVLGEGNIIIDNKKMVQVRRGIVKFYENKCMILVEEKKE